MTLRIRQSDLFIVDFDARFCWSDQEGGWDLACRYLDAVDNTLVSGAE